MLLNEETTNYLQEKKYLNRKMYDALLAIGGHILTIGDNNHIKLDLWKEEKDTQILEVYITNGNTVIIVSKEADADENKEYDHDDFTHFSNKEMKRIMDLYNIKY